MDKPTLAAALEMIAELKSRLDNVEKVVNDLPANELMLNNLATIISNRLKGEQAGEQGGLPPLFYKLSATAISDRTLRVRETETGPVVETKQGEEWVGVILPEDLHDTEVKGMYDYCKEQLPEAKEWFVTVVGKGSPFPGYSENVQFVNEYTGVRVKVHGADELTNPEGITMVMMVRGRWTALPVLDNAVVVIKEAFEKYNAANPESPMVTDRYYDFVMFELFAQYEDFYQMLLRNQAQPRVQAITESKTPWFALETGVVPATVIIRVEGDEAGKRFNFVNPTTGAEQPLTAFDITTVQLLMGIVFKDAPDAKEVYLALELDPLPASA